ncbi:DUF1971 domain-containing protein [Sphingopyxis yananensis]|uniref:DUF1971 domain-containing protein n=1 Tax=Sphingopyxis yananensis TaxID=2886687 RepID=UPI001D118C86|nr:DUF1971 domain-containing protein [Sphingopyxis yananensis]MCC2602774.1 DUF1971 domain-containing protein [Sphingopyxis yananensis]
MITELPTELQAYKRTPTFTQATVPTGLLSDHHTKDGVWGLIHVEEGSLRYRVTDPRRCSSDTILTADQPPAVVEPTIRHHVEPIGNVRFYVEFLKAPPA